MGHVPRMGEMSNAYKVWSENLRERALGRWRRRWEDNIKFHLKQNRMGKGVWTHLSGSEWGSI